MPDAELLTALKQAKSKKMFFAFIPKGAEGKLLVSKFKVPPKAIAEAKKEIGGGTAVTGKLFGGDGGTLVFQVVKQPAANLAAILKKVVHKETGLTIKPDVQLAGDADADEEDTGAAAQGNGAATAATTAPPAKPAADATATPSPAPGAAPGGTPKGDGDGGAVAAPKSGNVLGIQKALQKLGFDPGKCDGVMGPKTKAAIQKFQQANGLSADGVVGPKTQAVLAKALQGAAAGATGGAQGAATAPAKDGSGGASAPAGGKAPAPDGAASKSPAGGADDSNLAAWTKARDDAIKDLKALAAKVAATKHGSAAGVLKEISSLITRLPAKPAVNDIDKLEAFIKTDDTMAAAHEVPANFHKLDIRKPLLDALQAMKK